MQFSTTESKIDTPAPNAYFESGVDSFINHTKSLSFAKSERKFFNSLNEGSFRDSDFSLIDMNHNIQKQLRIYINKKRR